MQLPSDLKNQLENFELNVSLSEWTRAFSHLYALYHAEKGSIAPLSEELLHYAYLHVRMPATFAVLVRVLAEILNRLPSLVVRTLCDVGAGPGTGLWAAAEVFPIEKALCFERDAKFLSLAKKLSGPLQGIAQEWVGGDVTKMSIFPKSDLVIASYALGEMQEAVRGELVVKLWEATEKVLVLVEPGTPQGFKGISSLRTQLIDLGAELIAPCPHAERCPLGGGDWCHFSQRVERSSLHRKIKGGTLNYEDEKFSYLIFSREKAEPIRGRIVRHPQKFSGYMLAQVCGPQGLEQITVSRKAKDEYRRMRKKQWGDLH